jgi:hypothetical protein
MKNVSLFILAIILCQLAAGQNFLHEFGKYSNEEFELKKYAPDPSAEAVVIYDIGTSYFTRVGDGEFELTFERTMKIKVFTKAGLKYAQIEIPFYEGNEGYEKISDLQGNTYNYESGAIRTTHLNPDNTFNETVNQHWKVKKIAMPDVKEGSVFEVSYRISSPYLFNFRSWDFQSGIPTIYSEYLTKMNPFYEYSYILQGANGFDAVNKYEESGIKQHFAGIDYNNMVYDFIMKDVPAFKDESFITSRKDYIIKLDFQLAKIHHPTGMETKIMSTWPELCGELLSDDSFGRYLNTCRKKAKDTALGLQLTGKTNLEKIIAIDTYMKKNYKWNGEDDKFVIKTEKDFETSKSGNSAEINLYYLGLLNAAGIDAVPVLLSTRDHGKIKSDYPFQHFFNYVSILAKTDSSFLLLDGTDPLSNFREVPTRCINEKGLIVDKKNAQWITISSGLMSKKEQQFELNINATHDSVYETHRLVLTGYDAIDYRTRYTTSLKDLRTKLLGNNALLTDSLIANNVLNIEKPFTLYYKKSESIGNIDNKLIINPFCGEAISENPLKQKERTYPVDMLYRKSNRFVTVLNIPAGYKIFSIPENMSVDNNLVRIKYNIENMLANKITIFAQYEFKQDVYDPKDYADLRSYYNMIVSKMNEKIVLAKE